MIPPDRITAETARRPEARLIDIGRVAFVGTRASHQLVSPHVPRVSVTVQANELPHSVATAEGLSLTLPEIEVVAAQ